MATQASDLITIDGTSDNDGLGYKLSDIIDLEKSRKLLESFCEAVGIASAIIDLEGEVLIGVRWQDICTGFHRANEQTCARCIESDTELANELDAGTRFSLYKCKNGMTDAASPIIVEGHHVANAFVGQFLLGTPDEEFFRAQAKEVGFDEAEYISALEKVPIIEEEKVPTIMSFLTSFAETVAKMGLDDMRRKESEKSLKQKEYDLNERIKELQCLYGISELTEKSQNTLEDIFQGTVNLIPPGWQYPELTCARIKVGDQVFQTSDFVETQWRQATFFDTSGAMRSEIEVFYLEEMPEYDEGPFLKEERKLLDAIADRLRSAVAKREAEEKILEHQAHLESQVAERTAELERLHQASLARADAEIRLGNLAARLQGQRTVEDVSDHVLAEVIDFFNAPVGAVYVLEDGGYLRRRAGYALPPESASMDTFALGSGSVGQVAQLQQASFFNPGKGSFPIAYGFGQAAARQIVTYPMIVNGVLMGVIELCLFDVLDDQQVQWLEKAMQLSATALRFAQEGQERETVEFAVS